MKDMLNSDAPQLLSAARFIIVMGVAGSGKSTIGILLARKLGWLFWEGDDFHSEMSVRKMKDGIALTDDDRWPWLERLKAVLDDSGAKAQSAVLSCSSLKTSYRRILADGAYPVQFVYLKGTADLFLSRLVARHDHFMNPALLDSQFETLEEPDDAIVVDASLPPEDIVELVIRRVRDHARSELLPGTATKENT